MKPNVLTPVFLAALLLGGCSEPAPDPVPPPAAQRGPADPADVAANNRAVGLMGQYRYDEAAEIFAALAERHPEWIDVGVNLAIATFNRQRDGDESAATAMLQSLLERDPDDLRARFCLGVLLSRDGREAEATEQFRRVAEADPDDGYAAYFLGAGLERDQREESARWYARAIEAEPYLRSAYYRLASVQRLLDRADEASANLDLFQRLDGNPRARTVKMVYGQMGEKAEALAVDVVAPVTAPAPEGPTLMPPARLVAAGERLDWVVEPRRQGPSIAAADLDGDGDLDLFIADVLAEDAAANLVLLRQADGRFRPARDHVLAGVTRVNAALFGDVDDDGMIDVYLCRDGTNHLWRQSAPGTWEDVTAATGADGGEADTVDAALCDLDHDGDLDIFCANRDAPCVLLANDRAGGFRELAAERGIGAAGGVRRVVVEDLDGARDLDLILLRDEGPHEVWLNDRLWSWRPGGEEFAALVETPLQLAVAADLDADGRVEVHGATPDGRLVRFAEGDDGAWAAQPAAERRLAGTPSAIAALDLDGSGRLAIVTDEDLGIDGAIRAWAPVVLDADRGASILALPASAPEPVLIAAGPGRHAFVAIDPRGGVDVGKSMRSNGSGIGTRIAARIGSTWVVQRRLRASSGPGQSLQPMPVGLGGREHADYLAIDWPDGIFQSEVHGVAEGDDPPRRLAAGRVERIAEKERQTSSCPVLFTWNGARFVFVSDVLGVGGIGFLVEPGLYAEPRPWERFLLPEGVLEPREGVFELRLGEPMEEACYLDSARLEVHALPAGWDLVVDERMAIEGPAPTGAALTYRHAQRPVAATNDRGEDVTEAIATTDGVAAPVGSLDRRFIGRLAGEHVVELRFEAPLDAGPGSPVLVADGWVEYPYAQTMFAAWQAGATYDAPTLEARDSAGAWQVIAPRFGYPAGMPRRMALPLEGLLPEGASALRIRTNQEVYWDAIFVARAEPCPEARVTVLAPLEAEVAWAGFARRETLEQRRPAYDYDDRAPAWDTRHQRGAYTAFGPAGDLVAEADGALAIFGPGEETRLRFDARISGDLQAGEVRRFVLDLVGWCKDMDLYTRGGETLEPLPGDAGPAARAVNARRNVRFEQGR